MTGRGGARRRRLWWLLVALCLAGGAATFVLLHSRSGRPSHVVRPSTSPAVTHRRPHRHQAKRPPRPHDEPVPILMYHVIADAPAGAPFPELYVGPRAFDAQIAWLARHGYQAVTLERVYRFWRGLEVLPPHPVVLSFDDGYRGDIVNALPALTRRHWPGVLNLVVKNLGVSGGLNDRQVRRLVASGWELDAHSLTHADLTRVDAARLRAEVAGSRRLLRRRFHVQVPFFCYPSGRFDASVIAAVRRAGYLGATTTRPGMGRPSQLDTLHRLRIDADTSLAAFAASLTATGAAAGPQDSAR